MLKLLRKYGSLNFALMDQALASGANFLLAVILARRLGLEDFGVFMLAWLVLLFFKSLQGGLIITPMLNIGPKQADADRDSYYGAVLLYQLCLMVTAAAGILVAGRAALAIAPDLGLGVLMLPVLAACLGDQVQEFVRRWLFATSRAAYAFLVDLATYGSRILLLLFVLAPDSAQAFWFVAASSALGTAVALPVLLKLRPSVATARRFLPRQWRFAGWTAAAAVMEWGSGHLIVLAAGGILGPAVIGAIRATTNIFAALQALLLALGNVVPVRASALYARGGRPELARFMVRVTATAGAACLAILAVGVAFPAEILDLLYGPQFAEYAWLVYWWVAIYLVGFFQFPLSVCLSAVEHTRPFFVSIVCEACFGIASAFLLPRWFGLEGVMAGIFVTRALPVLVLGWFLMRWWRSEQAVPAALAVVRTTG